MFNKKAEELKKTVSTIDSLSGNKKTIFDLIIQKNDLYNQIIGKKKLIDQNF